MKMIPKMWPRRVVLCLLSAVLLQIVGGFNLETANYVRHNGPTSSMFGFTVATYKERGNSWILVGAPEAQNDYQPTVRRGGAVYRCTIGEDDNCQMVPFDRKGSNIDTSGREIDNKSGQWFGATLNRAGENGPVVACAPRYVYFTNKRDRREPVGTCYVSRGEFQSFSEYSPCRTALHGYHRHGSCQAGFSAAISNDGERLFSGNPGAWYWQGQVNSIDAQASFPFTPGKFGGAFGSGQVVQQSLSTRPAVLSTKEGIEKDDNSYMGYSIAVGDFTGDGEQGVAAGMPRGAGLLGKVVLFTWNLTNNQNITGTQLGAYFGYSIAVCDVDGDRTDDLIIGAPLHTEPNNEGKYEVGRVYVIYQGRDPKQRFRRFKTLDGTNSKSRFGLSVASLGDINLDGYDDFVVGAPYDGPHERGAVYVYHGSKDGVNPKHSQVIFSEDVAEPGSAPMTTFGFSVSGGIDLDHNDYPDMAVGAYLSNSAYFFRSRPVVKVIAFVQFLASNKQIILDEKNCTLLNGNRVPCTSIDICFNYTGLGVPHTINLDVQYVLDAKKTKDTRMFFIDSENKFTMNDTLHLQRDNRPICRQKMVYIKNDIKDKLTPLEAEIRYSMKESRHFQQQTFHGRDPKSVLLPILDLNVPPVRKDSISIHKNCGRDNVCIPDLRLIANSSVEKFLLGSNEKLQFDIIVQNEGEDSFETTIDLSMPESVDFNKIIQYDKNEVRFLCSPMDNNTIRCDIGNPLPAGKIARFTIQMTPSHKEGMSPIYEFSMAVNSTNPEDALTLSDNQKRIHIPIWANSNLELGGTSRPSDVHYNTSQYTSEEIKRESDIGPQVIHVYSIKNNGPSDITEAEMLFLLPYATLGGEDLLYLLEQPHTLGNVKCEAVSANYRDYELDYRKKTIWETIGIDTTKADFASAAGQTGGIFIEEGGEGARGALGGSEKVHITNETEDSGDGSLIHEQRRKQQQMGGASGSGTLVHVGEDGSRVRVETHSSSWNSSGSGGGGPTTVTHVYSKNTTRFIGPDGKVQYHESSSGNRHHGGASTSSSSSSSSSSGGSYSSGSATQSGSSKPQIIYTSTGKQHGNQQGNSFITVTSSDPNPNHDFSITGPEGRRSGQTFNHEDGGKTVYQSGEYPGNRPQTVNKNFDWNRGSQTNYNEQRGGGSGTSRSESGSTFRAEGGRVEGGHGSRVEGSYGSRTEGTYGTRTEGGSSWSEGGSSRTEGGSRVEGSYGSRTEGGGHSQGGSRVQGSHGYGQAGSRAEGSYNSWSEGGGASRNEGVGGGGSRTFESSYNQSRSYGTATTESGYHHQQQQQGGHGTYQSRYNEDIPYSSEEYIGESYENTYDEEEARRAAEASRTNRTHHQWSSNQGGHQQHQGGLDLGAAALGAGGFRTTTFDVSGMGGAGGGGDVQMSNRGGGAEADASRGGNKWESRSETHWSSSGTGDVPPQYHASASLIERDNVATDKPDYNNRFHGRRRRQLADDDDIRNAMQCKSTKCMMVRCVVGPLLNEQDAIIALRSRINIRALKNISTSQPISFSSMMLARISKLQYIGRPAERQIHSHEIFTTVPAPVPDKKLDIVPLWVVVVSAVAGTIILLLLIFLLYKSGFFKRNRHSDAPERQPLNRNGFYQNGDAAL